jgi:hypothetical protein
VIRKASPERLFERALELTLLCYSCQVAERPCDGGDRDAIDQRNFVRGHRSDAMDTDA